MNRLVLGLLTSSLFLGSSLLISRMCGRFAAYRYPARWA